MHHAFVDRGRLTIVALAPPKSDVLLKGSNHVDAFVGRSTIYNDQFQERIILINNTIQAFSNKPSLIVTRYDDTNLWQASHH